MYSVQVLNKSTWDTIQENTDGATAGNLQCKLNKEGRKSRILWVKEEK